MNFKQTLNHNHLKITHMKNLNYLALVLLMLGLTVSCATKSSPGAAAKQYMEYMADGNVDKFIDGIAFDEDVTKEEIEQGKTMMKSLIEEKAVPALEEKGGLKSVEVISEEISEDGKTATVTLKQTYGNGEFDEDETNMVLVDGRWKIEMGK